MALDLWFPIGPILDAIFFFNSPTRHLEKYQCENCDKRAHNHMITQSKLRVLCMQRSRIFPFQ